MCSIFGEQPIGRRDLLKISAAATVVLATNSMKAYAAGGSPTTVSPDEALAKLRSGNESYVSNPKLCSINLAEQRELVATHQAPWATIVSCADSRVPPELVFGGHGVGELFVARNAGNLVDTGTLGTVEYGAAVLGSPVIVILAHTSCGAVKAACDVVSKNATYPGAIGPMIEPIIPAALAVRSEPGDFVNNAAIESAKRTAARLKSASTLVADLIGARRLLVMAAIYDLGSGVVTYLD